MLHISPHPTGDVLKHNIFFINSIDLGEKKYYFINKGTGLNPAGLGNWLRE
jgi:hypothetical protein